MDMLKNWWAEPGNRQVAVLFFFIGLIAACLFFLGEHFAPALIALIIAYVLDGPTTWLEGFGLSRMVASVCMWTLTLIGLLLGLGTLIPAISTQVLQISPAVSTAVDSLREPFFAYAETNAWLIGPSAAEEMFNNTSGLLDQVLGSSGGLNRAVGQLGGVLSGALDVVIYVVIVPLMTFFFLKDRDLILHACAHYIPTESQLLEQVWRRTNVSISAYIRGKLLEIVILGVFTYAVFFVLGSKWALTIAIITGLSPIIPIFGAVIAGFITVLLTFAEFIAASTGAPLSVWFLVWCWAGYLVLQFFDGNLLQPLLFSEVVKLHPIAIFLAILVFGGLFGVWGLFFAIPAATLVRAILVSWPKAAKDVEAREGA